MRIGGENNCTTPLTLDDHTLITHLSLVPDRLPGCVDQHACALHSEGCVELHVLASAITQAAYRHSGVLCRYAIAVDASN